MKRVMLNEKEYSKLRQMRLTEMEVNKDDMSMGKPAEPKGEGNPDPDGDPNTEDLDPVTETAMYLQSLADYFTAGTITDDSFVPDFLANVKDIVGQYSEEGQIDPDIWENSDPENCDPDDPECGGEGKDDEYKTLDQLGDED
jgi:hypothetical protein